MPITTTAKSEQWIPRSGPDPRCQAGDSRVPQLRGCGAGGEGPIAGGVTAGERQHTLHGPKAGQGARNGGQVPLLRSRSLPEKRYSPAEERRQPGETACAEDGEKEEEKEADEAVGRTNTHLPRADRAAPAQP